MAATPAWEAELSSRAKEASKRRLSCGSESYCQFGVCGRKKKEKPKMKKEGSRI
jgi:hypothetical protein